MRHCVVMGSVTSFGLLPFAEAIDWLTSECKTISQATANINNLKNLLKPTINSWQPETGWSIFLLWYFQLLLTVSLILQQWRCEQGRDRGNGSDRYPILAWMPVRGNGFRRRKKIIGTGWAKTSKTAKGKEKRKRKMFPNHNHLAKKHRQRLSRRCSSQVLASTGYYCEK